MLAAHPKILSFPETHFFGKIRGRFERSRFDVVSPRAARRQLAAFATTLSVAPPPVWRLGLSPKAYGIAFAHIADEATRSAEKSVWIDKSPTHLAHVARISDAISDVRFIHVVRDGSDVVASFYAVCHSEPTVWVRSVLPGDPIDNLRRDREDHRVLFAIVRRWNRDITLSLRHRDDLGHHIVVYDRLVNDPVAELSRMSSFLGVTYDNRMLQFTTVARDIIGHRVNLAHMQGALEPLRSHRPGSRLEQVLPTALAERVQSGLIHGGDVERIFSSDDRNLLHDSQEGDPSDER
jgi:hypothetical protein